MPEEGKKKKKHGGQTPPSISCTILAKLVLKRSTYSQADCTMIKLISQSCYIDPSPTWVEECLASQTSVHVHSHRELLWAIFPSFHVGLSTCSLELYSCSDVYAVLNYSMFLQTPNVNTLKNVVKDLSLVLRSLIILWGSFCCSVWATLMLYIGSSEKKSASQSQADRNHDLWAWNKISTDSLCDNTIRHSSWICTQRTCIV